MQLLDAVLSDIQWDDFVLTYHPNDTQESYRKQVEQSLVAAVSEFSWRQYYAMSTTNQWFDLGEDVVRQSFAQVILRLLPDQWVTDDHYDQLDVQFRLKIEEYGLGLKPPSSVMSALNQLEITWLDRSFGMQDIPMINRILTYIGSNLVLQGGTDGVLAECILGESDCQQYEDYQVYFFHNEYCRTPSIITPMAAVIGFKEIVVRDTALASIFNQKWVSFYESGMELEDVYGIAMYVGAQIKSRVLSFYDVNRVGITNIQPVLISDLRETVLHHELGHAVIQHYVLPQTIATLGEASKALGETVIISLLELLAELAPQKGLLKGPFQNMCDISRQDVDKARRMVWMYFSDTFFYNTNDTYMWMYSDLMLGIYCPCLSESGDILFETLQSLLLDYFEWAIQQVSQVVTGLESVLLLQTYEVSGKPLSSEEFRGYLLVAVQSDASDLVDESAYELEVRLWVKWLEWVIENPDLHAIVKDYLEGATTGVQQALIEEVFPGQKITNIDHFRDVALHQLSDRINT